MQTRCLNGITVSRIGLGTAKFGRNQAVKYPQAFELPDDQQILTLLATARECGINLLDTAPAYGNSEERLGALIHRDEWVICTKAGEEFIDGKSYFDFSHHAITRSVERSLNRLQCDYIDFLLVHSDGNDLQILKQDDVFTTLTLLKEAGKIRQFGLSGKTLAGAMHSVEYADLAMITYNPSYQDEQPVIDYAMNKNKGIFVKKAFASGHLSPETALRFALSQEGVTSVMIGTINPLHLRANVEISQRQ